MLLTGDLPLEHSGGPSNTSFTGTEADTGSCGDLVSGCIEDFNMGSQANPSVLSGGREFQLLMVPGRAAQHNTVPL